MPISYLPVENIADFGVIGLLFTMWCFERLDKAKLEKKVTKYEDLISDSLRRESAFVDVIKENTKAITSLKEVIHGTRNRS